MAKTVYSKRVKSPEIVHGVNPEEGRHKLSRVCSHGRAQDMPSSPTVSYNNTCGMSSELIRDSMSKVFTGGWSCTQPLSSTYLNSRLLIEKQAFSTYSVCMVQGP